tara:strand:- start:988 stop:1587 length:600 start_codon:yes stop_codon:yes gene_type:complete
MALLQLAESPYNMLAENGMYLAEENPVGGNYLFIPAGMFGMDSDTYVRSDFFDSLGDDEFNTVIQTLAPYQTQGLSVIGIAAATTALAPAVKKAIANRQKKVAAGTAQPIFKPGGKLSNLAGKIKAGVQKLKDVPADKTKSLIDNTTPVSGSLDIGGTSVDFSTGTPAKENLFTKYKTPLLIGGAVLGGLLLMKVLKKK